MKRKDGEYGVRVTGCSGTTLYICSTETIAKRVRRVVKAYKAYKGFTGARTMDALIQLTVNRHGVAVSKILEEFENNIAY